MTKTGADYERNVFVNCPFDTQYHLLLRPLLFTIISLGFTPRIASERSDSGELRLAKIGGLIQESRFSIHDISRIQARRKGELYRMNMPFELGVDYGCRLFGGEMLGKKKCLILEDRPFRYVEAFSDLAGIDIKSHGEQPTMLVQQVRNWFVETARLKRAPSATSIWSNFTEFTAEFYDRLRSERFTNQDIDMMPVSEYVDFVRDWIRDRALPSLRPMDHG